jgi:Protein of unknown function (DUF2892)
VKVGLAGRRGVGRTIAPQAKKVGDRRTEIAAQSLYGTRTIRSRAVAEGSYHVVRNLPGWERAMRVIAGGAAIAYGLIALSAMPAGYIVAGVGAVAILTGFFGFCPMCAMVDRRLPSP